MAESFPDATQGMTTFESYVEIERPYRYHVKEHDVQTLGGTTITRPSIFLDAGAFLFFYGLRFLTEGRDRGFPSMLFNQKNKWRNRNTPSEISEDFCCDRI